MHAVPGDIVDGSGKVVPSAYRDIAAQMGTDAGVAYLYGAPASKAVSERSDPTWFQRPDHGFISDQNGGERQCNPGHCGTWQVGDYSKRIGDYSSNIGHVAFVADAPDARVGVSDLQISSANNSVFAQKPQLSWTLYGGGLDEINAVKYRAEGKDASRPVAVARCRGRPGWCISSIVAYKSGLIATAGNNTARNLASIQLPKDKVPTAIAVTNSSEFALVTVWDTTRLRGEIAVIALTGIAQGATMTQPAKGDWWGEWRAPHPGLPNLGNVGYMKLLGFVALPDMQAPTAISATTGVNRFAYLSAGAPNHDTPGNMTLADPQKRQAFMAGGKWKDSYAKSGIAVVASKSERKIAFVDLSPLFAFYADMYFGPLRSFERTRDIGPRDDQWPFTFAHAASQTPKLLKTVKLSQRPGAVETYAWGADKRAWVATEEGRLHTWDLGGYPGDGSPERIREIGSIAVGLNPTGVTLQKAKDGKSNYSKPLDTVIVTSRGDRRIDWIRFTDGTAEGKIVRTLRSSRLVDPISTEDASNHGTESYLISVADYGGRALRNYRYGPIIMHTYKEGCQPPEGCGMGKTGKDPFEYGGAFELPGKPFAIVGANIP